MRQYLIRANEYGANAGKLLKRRLERRNSKASEAIISRSLREIRFDHEDDREHSVRLENESPSIAGSVCIEVAGEKELDELAYALVELMHFDLRYFALAEMVSAFSYPLEGKKRVLKNALIRTTDLPIPENAVPELRRYLEESAVLNLEGYMRFRLRDDLEIWQTAADAAFADELEASLYSELFSLLGILPMLNGIEDESIAVVLRPDGSCTVTNQYEQKNGDAEPPFKQFRIECAPDSGESILALLSSLGPKHISLIDLSFGRCESIKSAIEDLFSPPN